MNASVFQVSDCYFDFTTNLPPTRYMTYLFPAGSVLPSPYNFGFFNMDLIASIPPTDGGATYVKWCNSTAVAQNVLGPATRHLAGPRGAG